MHFEFLKSMALAACLTSTVAITGVAHAATAKKAPLTADQFRTKVLATFEDMNSELTEARIVVPNRLPNSAPKPDQNMVLQERSDIIFARLVLMYELYGNFRVFGNLSSLQNLIALRPKGDAEFPNLTTKKLATLIANYKLASPSYVIGRASKTRWTTFAAHLAAIESNPAI